jgi:hypothetical protein
MLTWADGTHAAIYVPLGDPYNRLIKDHQGCGNPLKP